MKTKILFFLICNLTICNLQFSQNITNTLGSSGVFTLKDNTITYLSLSQSTGNLSLNRSFVMPYTTGAAVGVIYKGADRFMHNYGIENTFLGVVSGNFTMTGGSNTALGSGSMFFNSTGFSNTAIGRNSLNINSTGSYNTASGSHTLYNNQAGWNNTAVGMNSLYYNNSSSNTAVGSNSLYTNSTGTENTSVGMQSSFWNDWGSYNTALGFKSLFWNNGNFNTGVGRNSLYSNSTGIENTAVGHGSLYSNTVNSGNTAVGYNSLFANTGWQNTSVGHHSLQLNTTGNYNTAIGYNAGSIVTTGYNLTLIGIDANPTSGTASDQITLGNGFVTSLRCNVQTITSLSDARDKKNITELSLGLDFITKLHPRQFNWDKREWYDDNVSDGSKTKEAPTAGFIAQELDEVQQTEGADWLNLVLKDNPEKWEATYGNLLPVMVKAIQELKVENDKLKSEIEKMKSIEERLAKLELIQIQQNNIKEIKLTTE
jgi:trimeric autotransporter adhesin